jgi:hypothetical protein
MARWQGAEQLPISGKCKEFFYTCHQTRQQADLIAGIAVIVALIGEAGPFSHHSQRFLRRTVRHMLAGFPFADSLLAHRKFISHLALSQPHKLAQGTNLLAVPGSQFPAIRRQVAPPGLFARHYSSPHLNTVKQAEQHRFTWPAIFAYEKIVFGFSSGQILPAAATGSSYNSALSIATFLFYISIVIRFLTKNRLY